MASDLHPLGAGTRVAGAALSRLWGLPPASAGVLVEHDLRVPMRDGAVLLADHYAPGGLPDRPTVLVRTPYGRGLGSGLIAAAPLAARGYHVLIVSCRGTFGSGGTFAPMVHEAQDGQDVVAWLRERDWFDGRLATWGPSYLGFTQWALALDPPPELRAMVVIVGLHDVAEAGRGQGPLEFQNLLFWSEVVAHQEHDHPLIAAGRAFTAERRLIPRFATLPIDEAAARLGGDQLPFFQEWVDHESLQDEYWAPYRLDRALERVNAPVLLIGGWYDYFIDQTLQQYQTLRERGVPTRLVVGPWTHLTVNQHVALTESLAWFDHYAAGEGPEPPAAFARIFVTGAGSWLDLSGWPGPHLSPQPWYLNAGGRLTTEPSTLDEGSSTIRYDPADPTPSVGGRVMAITGGVQDNARLEARDDVLIFSTAPLEGPLEIRGRAEVTLHVASDSPHVDLFCRLCDVDPRGVSRNVADRIVRRDPARAEPGRVETVTLPLDAAAHRFLPGHRIRLQVAAGAFPRYARNLGFGEREATGRTMRVTHQTVYFDRSRPSHLTLPVVRVP